MRLVTGHGRVASYAARAVADRLSITDGDHHITDHSAESIDVSIIPAYIYLTAADPSLEAADVALASRDLCRMRRYFTCQGIVLGLESIDRAPELSNLPNEVAYGSSILCDDELALIRPLGNVLRPVS